MNSHFGNTLEKHTPTLGINISINSYQWEFLWESIPTLGISWRTKFQIWEQIFQSIPTSGNAQIPYKKPTHTLTLWVQEFVKDLSNRQF